MKTIKMMYVIFLALVGALIVGATHIDYDDISYFTGTVRIDVDDDTSGMLAYCDGWDIAGANVCLGAVNIVSLDYATFGRPITDSYGSNLVYRNLPTTNTSGPVLYVINNNLDDDNNALRIYSESDARALSVNYEGIHDSGIVRFANDAGGGATNYATFGRNDSEGAHYLYRSMDSTVTSGPVVKIHQDTGVDDKAALMVKQDNASAVSQEWWDNSARQAYIMANGTFYAKGYLDSTPGFEGNARNALEGVRSENGELVDESLPEFAQANCQEPITEIRQTCETYCNIDENNEEICEEICKDHLMVIGYEDKICRDLGAMSTLHTASVQELWTYIDELEARIQALEQGQPAQGP